MTRREAMALALGALGRESELGRRVGRILRFGELDAAGAGAAGDGRRDAWAAGRRDGVGAVPAGGWIFGSAHGRIAGCRLDSRSGARRRMGLAIRLWCFGRIRHADSRCGRNPTHRDSAAMNGAPRMAGRAKATALRVVQTSLRSRTVAGRGWRAEGRQWVVVTSWSGMDGSRVVMTTMTLPNVPQTAPRVSEGDQPSDPMSEPEATGQSQDAPQQVHPYAAVPVRGGWLVFQLVSLQFNPCTRCVMSEATNQLVDKVKAAGQKAAEPLGGRCC